MKRKFIPVEEAFARWRKDPAFVAAYDALEEEFALASTAIQVRMDIAALADEREGVRQGDADIAAGRTRPAEEVFATMRKKYRIPKPPKSRPMI